MTTKKQRRDCREKKKYNELNILPRIKYLQKIGIHVKPYKCPICDGWHITGQNKILLVHELIDQAIKSDRKKTTIQKRKNIKSGKR